MAPALACWLEVAWEWAYRLALAWAYRLGLVLGCWLAPALASLLASPSVMGLVFRLVYQLTTGRVSALVLPSALL